MEKNLIIRFLTTEAIKTPDRPKHKDRLWAAIRKAHRDVMTGARTGNISKYAEKNKDGKDETLEYLYQEILNAKERLSSSFFDTETPKERWHIRVCGDPEAGQYDTKISYHS